MTTAVMTTQNSLLFNFLGILKTIIWHNFVNAVVCIEQSFQFVFKNTIDPIFYITKVQTGPGFHICVCDNYFFLFFFFFTAARRFLCF